MNNLLKQGEELIVKINRLLDKTDKLAADNLVKDEQIRELRQQLKEKSEYIRRLEEERSSQKVLESIQLPGGDAKEAKKKINDYLREIDKCIARLSAEG
ncbi:MAG: hypothetical protein K1X61_09885 [Chitinophagales bacterium]|nr:hypothetical protein [Chitinophagales bacterium]